MQGAARRIVKKLPLVRRAVAAWKGGPRAVSFPVCWVRYPVVRPGSSICVFVMLAREGGILPHSVDVARAWHDAGFAVVVTIITHSSDETVDTGELDFAVGILLRQNVGYDFGAWAATILRLKESVQTAQCLAIANDSVLGPSAQFGAALDKMLSTDADVVGLVESLHGKRHLQSFVILFKQAALRSSAFLRYWRRVRSGGRLYVIEQYEMESVAWFERAGLRVAALVPNQANVLGGQPQFSNATLGAWDALLAAGFPFIKIQLLRDNPHHADLADWRTRAEYHGFDVAQLQRQIDALIASGPTRWAAS